MNRTDLAELTNDELDATLAAAISASDNADEDAEVLALFEERTRRIAAGLEAMRLADEALSAELIAEDETDSEMVRIDTRTASQRHFVDFCAADFEADAWPAQIVDRSRKSFVMVTPEVAEWVRSVASADWSVAEWVEHFLGDEDVQDGCEALAQQRRRSVIRSVRRLA